MSWTAQVKWNDDGLAPVIIQEFKTKQVLTLAWMNSEALQLTMTTKLGTYWSRSRQKLWVKGEQSGHQQIVKSIRLDCDSDAILLEVEQKSGIACHTGRHHCFIYELQNEQWQINEPVIKDPKEIYS